MDRCFFYYIFLSRYLWAVKLPPQNSANARELDGRSTARKSPIGSTNNQWGIPPPLIKVSLYSLIKKHQQFQDASFHMDLK
ncbi:hypothetical protein CN923_12040 [Bacillus cereus]|nr:hypothetical protein [Bacillus nitratireducens]PEA27446.1 hypothetical protein CON44_09335 [Bacillus cereus]PEQ38333.1 hypothetical protein CN467_13430 [Bacillus cereus]PEW97243.1 hypothetical protein CN446_12805 [Bacillus cereus]PEX95529.1 hypothetical protein CN465_13060 [Bacillus cereus]